MLGNITYTMHCCNNVTAQCGFLAMYTNDQLYSRRPSSFVGENEHAVDFALVFTGVINFTAALVRFVPIFVGDNGATVKLITFWKEIINISLFSLINFTVGPFTPQILRQMDCKVDCPCKN